VEKLVFQCWRGRYKKSSFIKDSHKTFLIGQKIPSGTEIFSEEDM